jgi:hypothetical protein
MSFVSAAQDFFDEGFNPLPLNFKKEPTLEKDHQFLYQKINFIEKRFKNCQKIGIACGEVSGGFYCIDFDRHGGQNLEPIFKDFNSDPQVKYLIKSGKLTCFKTPSAGYHLYFRYDGILSGTAYSRWADKEVMIELRGNGQYIACAPSDGYEYIKGVEFTKLDYIEKEELDHLIILSQTYNELELSNNTHTKSDKLWPEKWDDSTVQGKFNNEQGEYAKQLLIESGWKFERKRRHDGVELWIRPGKEEGTSATFGKMFNMFYVFSQNALPFEAEKAYSPFDIYKILKFNGNWQTAKDSLKPKIEPEPEPIQEPHSFFPIEIFPKFIQDYILALNKSLNFHIDFSAAAAMFTIATMNGNRYKLQVKRGWEAPTIFWFACVGYPGTIKTHPVKTLTRPMVDLDIASKRMYDEEMRHYDPDAKQKTPKPRFKQLLISDYTIEALHSIHDINKRGIGLYKDELKGFLNDMNKYRKGSDEEFWLESFNNGSYIVNRVTKEPVMINNICINIIGTIQHDVLTKVVTEYAGNGLIDRFLFTASESTVYNITHHEIDPDLTHTWNWLILELNRIFDYTDSPCTQIIKMSKETFKVYQEIDSEYVQNQNSEDFPQEIKNYLSKMKTYVPRFALLLGIMDSLQDGSQVHVLPIHMVNAKKIADYFVKTAQNVYQVNASFMEIKEIEQTMRGLAKKEKISKLSDKGFRQTELAKYFGISRQAVSKILNPKK